MTDSLRSWPLWFQRRRSNWLATLLIGCAAVFLGLLLAMAVLPEWFTSASPVMGNVLDKFAPPGRSHWFGTDQLGRDVYARVVYGAAVTFMAAGIAVGIGFVLGSAVGFGAVYGPPLVNSILQRLTDMVLAIPVLLAAIWAATIFGRSTWIVAVAVGAGMVPSFARLVRAELQRVNTHAFVESATVCGAPFPRLLFSHVIPNAYGPVLALLAIELATAILQISALAFLGLGAPPPQPEWGLMIAEGRTYLVSAWWLVTLPGIVIVATVLALSVVSRAVLRWASV